MGLRAPLPMIGLCYYQDSDIMVREYWAMIIECFGVTNAWEVGDESKSDSNYNKPVFIDKVEDLPKDKPIVVLAHKNAKYVQGVTDIKDFEHPEECIYVFGGDNMNQVPESYEGFEDIRYVYVDTKYEIYSHQIGAIMLYDRKIKNG